MAYKLIIKEGARLDADSAYSYYEGQQTGLGERFLSSLQERFTAISHHPNYYSYIDKRKLLRDIAVPHFPYVIVFCNYKR
jgi:hypothetical protein